PKWKIQEMGSRYLFIVLYCFIEKWLSRGDYHSSRIANGEKPSRTFNIAGAHRAPLQWGTARCRGFFVQDRLTGFSKSYPTQVLAVAALCIAAYACCLNNGFISDDYENLRLAEGLKSDFWYLFKSPPLNFRMTSFLAYAMLDRF